jgi:hypothetical protein
MQTPYLLDRTALFLVILFSLILVFFISELQEKVPGVISFSILISSVMLIHFIFCFNLSYVLEWKNDCNTKEMLSDLEKIKVVPEGKETISIGIPLIFDPAINFYREKNNLTWLNTAWRAETRSPCHDYYFLSKDELSKVNSDSLVILKEYVITGNVLARPKYGPKEVNVLERTGLNFQTDLQTHLTVGENLEFTPHFSYEFNNDYINSSGVVVLSAEVKAPNLNKNNLIMVLTFQEKNQSLISWQKAYVKDNIYSNDRFYRLNFTCIIPKQVKRGDEIKAYIWNPDKQLLYIRKMEFKCLSYRF